MRHGFKRFRIPGSDRGSKKDLLRLVARVGVLASETNARDLVSQLLHHEMILTTHRRAKFTAWTAEKMITKAIRNTREQRNKAQGFLRVSRLYNGPLRLKYSS